MSLFSLLTEKPWEQVRTAEGYVPASQASGSPPQKVALWFFMAVVTVMFGLFITAYYVRMGLNDWRPMPESGLLWVNTGLLFLASITLQVLQSRLKLGNEKHLVSALLLGSLFTLGFVYGQLHVWQLMRADGFFMYSNPANSFFYVLTGLHALHILGGLYVWCRAGYRVWSGVSIEKIKLSVELCALYWHFLLLVWLVLFALLSNT